MLLTHQNAEKCRIDMLGTCTSSSPIYVASRQDLCMLELFRDNKNGVKKNCQVKILVDSILPKAVSQTDGIWAVATKTELQMTQVCSGKSTTLSIFPPLTTLEIPMGCTAYGDTIILSAHYQTEESFEMRDSSVRLVI